MNRRISAEILIIRQINMKNAVLFGLPLISALCAVFSLPAFEYGFLAWFCLVPFLYALRQVDSIGGAALGFLFGYVYGYGTFAWLPATEGVSQAQFIFLIVPTFSLFYVAFGLLYSQVRPAVSSWIIIVGPALWVALEYARANFFFLSLPWNFFAHSQYRYLSLIQIADITGMYGVSFLVVMVNQFLSQVLEFFSRPGKKGPRDISGSRSAKYWVPSGILIIILIAFTIFYGRQSINMPEEYGHLRVAIVQANVMARDNMSRAEQLEHLKPYRQLSLKAAEKDPDLIIWPASSLPASFRSRVVRRTVQQIARESGTYLLVGGAGVEKLKPRKEGQLPYSNSEFLIGPNGRIKKQYNKIHLVPFNEYLPLQGKIKWPRWITPLELSFIRGEEYTLFEVSEAKFGTPICWEGMFSNLFRHFVKAGANFMVNVTNDGFTGRTAAPYQTLAMTVFRAVENRVVVLRASTTGVSCYISPTGEIVERIRDNNGSDIFVSGILVRDVPLHNTKTFYAMYGDMFAFTAIGVSIAALLVSIYARWRRRSGMRAPV
jgi:apolipoprotein N-acyltransferase